MLSSAPINAGGRLYHGDVLLQDAACVLNQRPLYGSVSSVGKIHDSRNQGMNAGVAPLTITLNDPLGFLCLWCLELRALQNWSLYRQWSYAFLRGWSKGLIKL